MSFPTWNRFAPLAGALAIVCWIVAFAIAGDNPDTGGSDAKIVSYYASSSNQHLQIVGFFVFLAGVLLLLAFLSALRARLVAAEGAPGRLTALAFGSGAVSAVLWVLAITCFIGPAFAANDTSKFKLDPNTYRLIQDLGYGFWIAAVIVAAPLVWATSAVALRAGLLPKWYAWLAVLAGVLQLFAIFFVPAFIFWGWVLFSSLLLTFRAEGSTAKVAIPAA